MKIEIVSPDANVLIGDCDAVIAPGVMGEFEVLPGHATMVAALGSGSLTVKNSQQKNVYSIQGGVFEIRDDKIRILADGCTQA